MPTSYTRLLVFAVVLVSLQQKSHAMNNCPALTEIGQLNKLAGAEYCSCVQKTCDKGLKSEGGSTCLSNSTPRGRLACHMTAAILFYGFTRETVHSEFTHSAGVVTTKFMFAGFPPQHNGQPTPALKKLQIYTEDRSQAYFVMARTVDADDVCGDTHFFVVAPSDEPPYWCLYQSFGTQKHSGYSISYYLGQNDYHAISNSEPEELTMRKAKQRFVEDKNRNFWDVLPRMIEGSAKGAKWFGKVFGCAPVGSKYKGIRHFEIAKARIQKSDEGSYPGFDELQSDRSVCSHLSPQASDADGQVSGAARTSPASQSQS